MEQVNESFIKRFLKKLWTRTKPLLPAMALVAVIIIVVTVFTYLYFTCTKGSIPADRIIDDNAIKKSDWLLFWGSILAVVCTLSLALVSYKQNKDLKKMNDDREKKDTFFAKLRFAAEFYSMIEFTSLSIEEHENNKVTLSFDITQTGKMPANTVYFSQIMILPTENDEKILKSINSSVQPIVFDETETDIKSNQNQGALSIEKPRGTISVNMDIINYELFKGVYEAICYIGKSKVDQSILAGPTLQVSLNYSLENPVNVKTQVFSNMSLTSDFSESSPDSKKKAYIFTTSDISNSAILYDYIGEVK